MRRHGLGRRNSKGDDSWQVIYMDLMTMVMVFFVILWSLNQGKDDGVSETVGDVTARMIDLPGDVLFKPGKVDITGEGKEVVKKLFHSDKGGVISFETNDLAKRMLVVHGHTDGDGGKDQNLNLGFQRALSAYGEIKKYSNGLADHVVVCSHADNSPVNEIPQFKGKLSKSQKKALRLAKQKNRRITIEDKIVNQFEVE